MRLFSNFFLFSIFKDNCSSNDKCQHKYEPADDDNVLIHLNKEQLDQIIKKINECIKKQNVIGKEKFLDEILLKHKLFILIIYLFFFKAGLHLLEDFLNSILCDFAFFIFIF